MRPVIALAALALPLSGCGAGAGTEAAPATVTVTANPQTSQQVDTAWRKDIQRVYGHPILWIRYRQQYIGKDSTCAKSQAEMETYLAVGQDMDGKWGQDNATDLEGMRVSFRYVCPDRLPVIDKALQVIEDAKAEAPTTDCGPLPKKKPAEFALMCHRLQNGTLGD